MTYRIALIGLLMGGCYAGYGQQQQTLPEPVQVAGPPGGNMDQGYDQNPQDPAGYQQGYQQDPAMGYQGDPGIQQDPNVDPDAQPVDPQQDAAPMADVQDTEIDATLQGYGSWEEDEDYGRVWRPDVTIVGADFTPYDTCGSWGYSEYGWTFNCDYGWGWLPFHYGRWGWIGSSWGWVPGHQWGPGWVDWRHGGGKVGWRPMLPEHGQHGNSNDPYVRDHRHGAQALDSHWHFQNEGDLGRGHIRGHELNNPAEGLSVTTPVAHPPIRGTNPIRAASVMGARHSPATTATNGGATRPGYRPNPQIRQPEYRQPAYRQPTYQQPAYRQPTQRPTYQQPAYRQPTYQQPAYRQPTQRPTYQQPAYRQPTYQRPAYTQRPTFQPARPTYTPPSRPSYSAPSRPSYSAPSHSSSPAPSHSSGSSSSSHSSSSSSSSHSSSSGGHHR